MNRQQAKEILPIIEAYAAGKTIQVKSIIDGLWYDYDNKELVGMMECFKEILLKK